MRIYRKIQHLDQQIKDIESDLVVQGTRAIMQHIDKRGDALGPWVRQLLTRRHSNVVACALANYLARIVWGPSVVAATLTTSPNTLAQANFTENSQRGCRRLVDHTFYWQRAHDYSVDKLFLSRPCSVIEIFRVLRYTQVQSKRHPRSGATQGHGKVKAGNGATQCLIAANL